MRNTQKAEKKVTGDGSSLEVNSIFYTIQGEGPFSGMPAVFIRLAGCNLQCPDCDTEYTDRTTMEVGEIITAVYQARDGDPSRLVVITGGEPFRQPLGQLLNNLLFEGFKVQIETNGTLYQKDLPYKDVYLICSPKTGAINKHLENKIHALKYVINARAIAEDNYPTLVLSQGVGRVARPPQEFAGIIYMQPYDSGNPIENEDHQVATVGACMATGNTYCHQLHKLLGLE